MTQNATKLLTEALELSAVDRGELVAQLLESLDPAADENADLEWDQEIQMRVDEIRAGGVQGVAWEEARRMILDDTDVD